jgi:cyclopropane fatty-acyl-phospholipid synthase-like methyltransferase
MLKLNEAKNILEIGCGAGKLLSTVLDLKNP